MLNNAISEVRRDTVGPQKEGGKERLIDSAACGGQVFTQAKVLRMRI